MEMKVSSAINAIVEAMLPRFSPEDRFLHIPVGANVSCYSVNGFDTDVTIYRDIHFLFQRPHNYTKVWVAVDGWDKVYEKPEDQRFGKWVWRKFTDERVYNIDDLRWYMTSDHDSCWRSDGVDSPMFELRMQMQRALEDEVDSILGREHTPLSGQNANWFVSLDPIGGRIEFYTGGVARDNHRNEVRGDNYDYMKLPVNLERVEDARQN